MSEQLEELDPHAETLSEQIRSVAFYHSRFESIHGFRDGNGRMGRLLTEHAMIQIVGREPRSVIQVLFHAFVWPEIFAPANVVLSVVIGWMDVQQVNAHALTAHNPVR